MKKNKRRTRILLRIKSVWSCLTLLILLSIVPVVFVPACNRLYQLKYKSKSIITAVVIVEKEYLPNSPVAHAFYYKYFFTINGEILKGSTQSHEYKPGDSIKVEYVIQHPEYNEPAH